MDFRVAKSDGQDRIDGTYNKRNTIYTLFFERISREEN